MAKGSKGGGSKGGGSTTPQVEDLMGVVVQGVQEMVVAMVVDMGVDRKVDMDPDTEVVDIKRDRSDCL